VNIRITGAPDPATAAAIVAALESVLRAAPTPPESGPPAWTAAAIRDNVRPAPAVAPGIPWRTVALP
jgi:hypothetical protein